MGRTAVQNLSDLIVADAAGGLEGTVGKIQSQFQSRINAVFIKPAFFQQSAGLIDKHGLYPFADGLGIGGRVVSHRGPGVVGERAANPQGRPVRLRQVLTNLVSNAVKYTPNGGSITIRVSRHGEGPRVDVTDTGIGLSDEDQPKVFSRFFRSRNAQAQAAAGTGLGLAISKALVEQQGGAITFTSRLQQGSTFTFTLPPATQGAAS